MENTIIVTQKTKSSGILEYKKIITNCFFGKNGLTYDKKEGDKKTPLGLFELGICFGTHDKKNLKISENLNYIRINKDYYWIDDINSKYYNQLININNFDNPNNPNLSNPFYKDWISAEHLIDYPIEYEYAIEIKSNPNNFSNKGSAIFLHCSNGNPTSGCIAIETNKMKKILSLIKKNTKILIKI